MIALVYYLSVYMWDMFDVSEYKKKKKTKIKWVCVDVVRGKSCVRGRMCRWGKSCSQTRKQLKVQNLIICRKLDDTCTCYSFKPFKNITDSSTSPGRRVPRDSHYLLNKKKQTNIQTHTYTHTAVKAFQRATQSFSHWDKNINNSKRRGFHAEIKASRFGFSQ